MIHLDKKDFKLLAELDFNARATLTELGKNLRLSKQAAINRIKKLEARGMIEGYYTVVNIAKLGLTAYRLALKFQNFTAEDEKELFAYCRSMPEVGWLFSVNGKWDVVITVYAKSTVEFNEISQKIIYKYGAKILEDSTSIVISIYTYPNKFLTRLEPQVIETGGEIETLDIDELDKNILKALSDNARIPLVKMAVKLNQNARTINYRIKRLKKLGIIQGYRAKINTNNLSYNHYKIFLNLQNMTKELMRSFLQYFKLEQQVVYSTLAIGLADLEFEAKLKTPEELYQLINKLRNQFRDQIKSSDSVIIRKEQMINYYPF